MVENTDTNIIRKLFKEKSLTVILIFYFISAIVPFVTTVIWGWAHTNMCLMNIFIYCISLFLGVGLTIILMSRAKNKTAKIGILGFSIAVIIIFVFTYDFQIHASKIYYVWSRQEKLNTLVKEINEYDKITHMDDGTGVITFINNEIVRLDEGNGDEKIIRELNAKGIDHEKYFRFQKMLKDLEVSSMCREKGNPKEVSFLITGFLDNSYGIAYSEVGDDIRFSCRGPIKATTKILGNWYSYSGWS